ncbi:nuclear transport factor 2 family protein [Raoultibacter timonensis]|uniref:nuclear transport factor 2 family protein n=1 Tax=Raoultibacter timonensis TaxID=1907662 RepID=UPI0011AED5D4|nr:nuclear transport factor 2 family protein [Raoultibacter timonensis]
MEDTILALEKKLLDMNFCKDIKNLEDILAADFVEYGSSEEVYSRKEAIENSFAKIKRK